MLGILATTIPMLSAPTSGPQFSSESLYQTGGMIALVGIGAVLLNLVILMIVVKLSARVIERFSSSEGSKDGGS